LVTKVCSYDKMMVVYERNGGIMKHKYTYRSLHLDCARHFFSVETVKKVIEGISYGNLNVLHWHLSDDHGWRIESKKFSKLHECSREYYTQEEDVLSYALFNQVAVNFFKYRLAKNKGVDKELADKNGKVYPV